MPGLVRAACLARLGALPRSRAVATAAPQTAAPGFHCVDYAIGSTAAGYDQGWLQLPEYLLSPAFRPHEARLCEVMDANGGLCNGAVFWNLCLALASTSAQHSRKGPLPQMFTPRWLDMMAQVSHVVELDSSALGGFSGMQLFHLFRLYGQLQVPLGPAFVRMAVQRMIHDGVCSWLEAPDLVDLVNVAAFHGTMTPDFIIMIGQRLVQPTILHSLQPADVLAIVSALGDLRVKNAVLLEALAIRVAELAHSLTAMQIAQVLEALARAPFRHEGLIAALVECLPTLPLAAPELAALSRGFAAVGEANRAALGLLAARATAPGLVFGAEDAAAVLLAFATLGVTDEGLKKAMLEHFDKAILASSVTCQALSDLSRASVKLKIDDSTLLPRAAEVLCSANLPQFSASAMQGICQGFARQHIKAHALFERLAARALAPPCAGALTAIQMADVLWAFATLGPRPDALLRHCALRARDPAVLRDFTADDVAHVAWAYAVFAWPDKPLLEALAVHALTPAVLRQFNESTVSTLYWAYNTLGYQHDELFSALKQTQAEARVLAGLSSPLLRRGVVLGSAALLALLGLPAW